METQSVLFNKNKYTKKQAEKWLVDNGYKVKKVDITENLRRYRQLPPGSFNQKTYRMKKLKGNDLMLVVGKRLKKDMPDKKKVPKGSHRMPDGSIMKDKDMKGHKCKSCADKEKKGKKGKKGTDGKYMG